MLLSPITFVLLRIEILLLIKVSTPTTSRYDANVVVVIVVISRLYYNKGIDLLVAVIPRICAIHPGARFIIAGDGPKFLDLEQMREKYMLQDRVEMLGSIRHEEVRDVFSRHELRITIGHDSRRYLSSPQFDRSFWNGDS
jgi:glycosyltransferase involved in cell wall biosynthesis